MARKAKTKRSMQLTFFEELRTEPLRSRFAKGEARTKEIARASFVLSKERKKFLERSSKGGKNAQKTGKIPHFTKGEAKTIEAASKGGLAASRNRKKMQERGSKGGKRAHELGRGHEFDSAEAKVAGSKGGQTTSRDREWMSFISRRPKPRKKNRVVTTSDPLTEIVST